MQNATRARETLAPTTGGDGAAEGRKLLCDLCGTDAEWATGGGAQGVTNVCDLHRGICDAEPDNDGTEWWAVRGWCDACDNVRDGFGACACSAVRS